MGFFKSSFELYSVFPFGWKAGGNARCTVIGGELAIGRGSSRHNLVFGGSIRIRSMMQPCASAAKLRGGGSNLNSGLKAIPLFGAPPPRITIGSPSRGCGWAPKPFLSRPLQPGRS
jgi:hypothetical protein